jgi:magnesium-transporting ATPase (P-type)
MSMRPSRSAGVTAAATLAILGGVTALFVWGNFFLMLMNAPPDENGRHLYQTHTVAFLLIALVPSGLIALGIRTGIGLFQLRSWARSAALIWASLALIFCLAMIAFRPFETFFIPDHFVSDLESLKQLVAISFILLLFPVSLWWLFLFRSKSVKLQFLPADSESAAPQVPESDKS